MTRLPHITSIRNLVKRMNELEAMRPRQSVRVSESNYMSKEYVLRRGAQKIATVSPAILEHNGPHVFYYCRVYKLCAEKSA